VGMVLVIAIALHAVLMLEQREEIRRLVLELNLPLDSMVSADLAKEAVVVLAVVVALVVTVGDVLGTEGKEVPLAKEAAGLAVTVKEAAGLVVIVKEAAGLAVTVKEAAGSAVIAKEVAALAAVIAEALAATVVVEALVGTVVDSAVTVVLSVLHHLGGAHPGLKSVSLIRK